MESEEYEEQLRQMHEYEKKKSNSKKQPRKEEKKEDNKTKVKNFFSRAMQKIEDVFEPEIKKQQKQDEEERQFF